MNKLKWTWKNRVETFKIISNVTLCHLKPNEYNLQTTITNLSDSGNTILVRFCHYNVIVGLWTYAKDIQTFSDKRCSFCELLGATDTTLKMQL